MSTGDLKRRSAQAARDLGHRWIGTEHYVLALLDPEDRSIGGRALRQCGLARHDYVKALAQRAKACSEHPGVNDALPHSRALDVILAKAEGLALGQGRKTAGSEHILIAMLWKRGRPPLALQLIQNHCAVTRRQIADSLAALGVDIPVIELPPDLVWTESRVVSREAFKSLQADLVRQGLYYGCRSQPDSIEVYIARTTAA